MFFENDCDDGDHYDDCKEDNKCMLPKQNGLNKSS